MLVASMPEHTPAPTPSRAVYGFVLYLGSNTLLALFLLWAIIPEDILLWLGITYWPQKCWAVTLPVYGCVLLALFAFFVYPGLNFMLVPSLDDPRCIMDGYSRLDRDIVPFGDGIPPAGDLSPSYVCRVLYTDRQIHAP